MRMTDPLRLQIADRYREFALCFRFSLHIIRAGKSQESRCEQRASDRAQEASFHAETVALPRHTTQIDAGVFIAGRIAQTSQASEPLAAFSSSQFRIYFADRPTC